MAKNIVICSDGTGNSAIKGRGTNVFRIFESVDLNGHRDNPDLPVQVAIYDDGVGTQSFKLAKMVGGAAGYGLSRNVKQLYKELCRIYDPGDRIFLFGFSRGAFTVRTLAGFICTCGIVKVADAATSEALERKVTDAYKAYRRCYRTKLMKLIRGKPGTSVREDYREKHSHGGETISFIGVWDTVDAVGLPLHIADVVNASIYQFKFPSLALSPAVEHACHALAIDDERQSFHPLLWKQGGSGPGQLIEQVWFSGVHSNVGGGYPKQGMSLVALDWLMQKAESAGLRFLAEDRAYYRGHANVDDKLYNPRAGTGMFYRWLPRPIGKLCEESGIEPVLHLSVLERIAHGTEDYGPGNLPSNARVVFTPTGDRQKDRAMKERAEEVQKVLAAGHVGGGSPLDRVQNEVRVGRWSYRIFLLAVIATLIVAAAPPDAAMFSWSSLKGVPSLVGGLATSPIDTAVVIGKRLLTQPVTLCLLVAGFLLSFALASYSDRRIARAYSQFWFAQQQYLRKALKHARATAKERVSREPSREDGAAVPETGDLVTND